MAWDIPGAIKSAEDAFLKVFDWKTGGRTQDQNKDIDEADHWREEEEKARLSGDYEHASFARERLFKLQRKAIAKSGR